MERLDIAIPFHRNVAYLEAAIESVLGQERSDWRLLVCDDGLPDQGAGELVLAYGDERLRYLRNERPLGMAGNWNRCLQESGSELVTLLHGDDRLCPNYVGLMAELASADPGAVAFACAAGIIDARGSRRFSLPDVAKRWFVPGREEVLALEGEAGLRVLMAGNFIMCPTLCFRMSALGPRRFAEEWSQVQDLELTSRLLMDGARIVYSRRVAYEYRRHAQGATQIHSESMLRFDEEFRLYERVGARARELCWPRAARVSARKRIVRLHLLYRALAALLGLRVRRGIFLLRYLRAHSGGAGAPS